MKPEIISSCNINKSFISRILTPWSSSKANEYRKDEAVEIAIKILRGEHQLDRYRFYTGAFSEGSHLSSRAWLVDRVTSTISELGAGDEVLKVYDFSDFVIDH